MAYIIVIICGTYFCDYLPHITFCCHLINFHLNADSLFKFYVFDLKIAKRYTQTLSGFPDSSFWIQGNSTLWLKHPVVTSLPHQPWSPARHHKNSWMPIQAVQKITWLAVNPSSAASKGQSAPPPHSEKNAKNRKKVGKIREKRGKEENREEKAKFGTALSLSPFWQEAWLRHWLVLVLP